MLFGNKCDFCRKKIGKGRELKAKVEVFGRVGKWKKNFCSGECLEGYECRTEDLMKTRRPNICTRCVR